jgi:hypothetical protein
MPVIVLRLLEAAAVTAASVLAEKLVRAIVEDDGAA